MKVLPIRQNIINMQSTAFKGRDDRYEKLFERHSLFRHNRIKYPSGYYSQSEVNYAKKYLGQKEWEEDYAKTRYDKEIETFTENFEKFTNADPHYEHWVLGRLYWLFWMVTIPTTIAIEAAEGNKAINKIKTEIKRISTLMVDLNNEKIKEAQKRQEEAKRQEDTEKRKSRIYSSISNGFLNFLESSKSSPNVIVPTAIMISGSTDKDRSETIDWIKRQIDSRVVDFTLSQNEDNDLFRINTEIDYAKDYFERNKVRTVLFVEDFDFLLNNEKSSPETVEDMKELLSNLHVDKSPVTIVFATGDKNKIDSAFLSNKTRISYELDLDKI